MAYDYSWSTQVYNNGWVDADYLSLSTTEELGWSGNTCKFSLSNGDGNMRALCLPERQIKAVRNNVQAYLGIVNKAKALVTAQGYNLEVDSRNYYEDMLHNKQTGDSFLWNFERLEPADLLRAFIGTLFIMQEKFVNQWRINESAISNVTFLDQQAQLSPNGATFQPTGYYISNTLQNTDDWDTMGKINSVAVTITGTFPTGSGIGIQVSRDDGANLFTVPLTYDGVSQFTGSYTFVDAPATKNKLKYKLTLTAGTSNLTTPTISEVLIKSATDSDTGVTEGFIETWSSPPSITESDDTITQDFGSMSRFQAIETLVKITGQEGTLDGTGKIYVYNKRCGVNHVDNSGADYHFDASAHWNLYNGASILDSQLTLVSDGITAARATVDVSTIPANDTLCFAVRAAYADSTGAATQPLCVDLYAAGYDNAAQELDVAAASLTNDYQIFTRNDFNTGAAPATVSIRLFTFSTRPIKVDWIVVAKRPVFQWDTDTNITNLTYERIREAMANAVIVMGSGNITDEVKLYGKYTLENQASIAKYGRIEKRIQEKNIADLGALGARAYVLLEQLKEPADKLSGTILDPTDSTWQIGDRVCVVDKTGTSGVDASRIFRISKVTRNYSADGGETVSVEFCNVNTDLESAINAIVDYVNSYVNTEQATSVPTPATAWTEVDKDYPAECLVWIDPTKSVERIILNVFSRKFRTTSKGGEAGGSVSKSADYTGLSHRHWTDLIYHAHSMGGTLGLVKDIYNNTVYVPLSVDGSMPVWVGGPNNVPANTSTYWEDTGHSHGITIAAHVHPPVYGIYEFGYYAPVTMHINNAAQAASPLFGTQGSENATTGSFTCSGLDITSIYDVAGGAGKLGPGRNFIYFKTAATANNPSGLLRLYTQIQVIYK